MVFTFSLAEAFYEIKINKISLLCNNHFVLSAVLMISRVQRIINSHGFLFI